MRWTYTELVYVDVKEDCLGVLLGELRVDWSNLLAGSAPACKEREERSGVRTHNSGREVGIGLWDGPRLAERSFRSPPFQQNGLILAQVTASRIQSQRITRTRQQRSQ